jgi:hypothetical protein
VRLAPGSEEIRRDARDAEDVRRIAPYPATTGKRDLRRSQPHQCLPVGLLAKVVR